MESLAGKVALVTGGAQGFGLAVTHLLLKRGAKVGVLDVMSDQLDNTCKQLEQQYGKDNVLRLLCDVSDSKKLVTMFAKTKETFGSLDIVCNNAGISVEKDWEKLLSINLNAVILGTKTAMEHMSVNRGGKGGVVINVSSMAGLYATPLGPVYSASKSGVIYYTLAVKESAEARGVRVNCICPWYSDTRMGRELFRTGPEYIKNEVRRKGLVKPSMVAEGILELITDTTRSGAVMRVTPTRGLSYHTFDAAPPTAPRSKL